MIKVSIMYPNNEGTSFNLEYYCNTHIPMVVELLGDTLKSSSIDSGIAGGAPDESAPFIAMGHLTFESIEAFQNAFAPNAKNILADLPNFTNTQPRVQISQIKT